VFAAIASLAFGVYKNIESNNAKGFAYEQAYRVMNVVKTANIGPATKANILNAALGTLATPPPVIDLSQSNAATVEAPACSDTLKTTCVELAQQLATANATHTPTTQLKKEIADRNCFICFTQ
jgi:hypothetical protein